MIDDEAARDAVRRDLEAITYAEADRDDRVKGEKMKPTSTELNILDTMILNHGVLATDAMRHMGVRGPTLARLLRRGWVYMIAPGLWGITGDGSIAATADMPAWSEET